MMKVRRRTMTMTDCTVDQAICAMYTARDMQQYALDYFPLAYIDKLIDAFRSEPEYGEQPDYDAHRLYETIPLITMEEAYLLASIKAGALRDMGQPTR
jgi:hypothetical protein